MAENQDSLQPQKGVERLIFRDELTDVFNRRYLYQYLPQEISRSKNVNQGIWLFMIDIDDFKSINDKYGHLRGDEVLKSVAVILKKCVRSEDTVIRYAGDEFTIVLPGANISSVTAIAKRINSEVSKTSIKSDIAGLAEIKVNLSLGAACFPDDAGDSLRLIDLADKALYVSKQKGKNRISFVSDISAEILRAREILEVFPCPKLIEREKELKKLLQIYEAVSLEKNTRLALVTSEVGLGKSRLIEEFSKAVEKKGVVVFLTRCSEKFMNQPYRNLMLNLESYLKSSPIEKDKLFANIPPEGLALLVKIFPFLSESLGPVDLPKEETRQKESDIENCLKLLLKNISESNNLILIFEDFQWIDENTLNLIFSIKKEAKSILILCGLRRDAKEKENPDYPINRLKDDLAQDLDDEIKLEPLTFSGATEMISVIFPDIEKSERFESLIYKVTKGNPLFIEELLKFLIQKGFIYYHKGHWGKIEIQEPDIPHTLEEVILERFRGLDRATQELISQAAVIGQDFNIELLHRLGKQDEGYILDILESAQKVGLIKKSQVSLDKSRTGEELSFVSDEIRRVLYNMIEQDKIKDLHKQLGEIEEGLYSNNLDQIAGELFFHFKKAEDFHRAKVYAQRVKEAQGQVLDNALKYAHEILQGVEEERAAPLSNKSQELVGDIIRGIYILNINTLLYPSGSTMVTTPTEELFGKLSEIFVRDEVLIFSAVKGALVVNGERLKEKIVKKMFEEAFLNFLRSSRIESISFKRGLTKTEFSEFINIITRPLEDKTFAEQIKSKGIYQVEIKEVSYTAISSSEKAQEREKLEEAMLMDYLLSKLSGQDKPQEPFADWDKRSLDVANALTQIAEKAAEDVPGESVDSKQDIKATTVQKAFQNIGSQLRDKNPQEWDKYKKGLAKAILNLEPKLRRDVLVGDKLEGTFKGRDIIREISSEFPDEVVLDLFSQELGQKKVNSPLMRSLVQKFLSDNEQKQRILPKLKDKLAKIGLPKEDLSWVTGESLFKDFDLEERVKRFLSMSIQDYLNLENEIDINSLISEALGKDRQDLFNAILKKWREFLKADSLDLRRRVVKNFMHIIESIPISRPELLIILLDIVFNQLASEAELDIYAMFLNEITKPLGYLIDSGNFAHAKIILEKLQNEISRVKGATERQKCIQELMEKIFHSDRLKLITAEFIKRIDNNSYHEDIKDFILNIGEVMVNPLIEEAMIDDKVLSYLGYFGAYLRRRAIGELLAQLVIRFGPNEVCEELKIRLNDEKWYIVKNAIELFVYLQNPQLLKLLESSLKAPDVNIRKKVIFVLNKINSPESTNLLIEALKDPDTTVALSAVQSLSKIADESVLAALKNLHHSQLQEEINRAIESVENLLGRNLKRER